MNQITNIINDVKAVHTYIRSLSKEHIGNIITLMVLAVIMIVFNKYGLQITFHDNYMNFDLTKDMSFQQISFWSNMYFFIDTILFFVLLPLMIYFFFPHEGPNPFGLSIQGLKGHYMIYIIMFIIMLPIVWKVCGDPLFNQFYPFYDPENLFSFIIYETVYLSHFFSVEFFFRGFLLFRFEPVFKEYTLWVILIPYVFIHIFKPFPEAMGSVIAGIVLGSLSLRYRSIWPGIILHGSIALSADLFSLIRTGRLIKLLQ